MKEIFKQKNFKRVLKSIDRKSKRKSYIINTTICGNGFENPPISAKIPHFGDKK